ncbi:MAG: hypothetical protein C4289_15885 [Chloroflexota bacterium]
MYNEAAIAEIVVNVLPKLAEAVSAPLAKTERIVIIGGSDGTVGANRLARDISDIIAQLPTIVEAISGQKLSELVERTSGLRGASARANGAGTGGGTQAPA